VNLLRVCSPFMTAPAPQKGGWAIPAPLASGISKRFKAAGPFRPHHSTTPSPRPPALISKHFKDIQGCSSLALAASFSAKLQLRKPAETRGRSPFPTSDPFLSISLNCAKLHFIFICPTEMEPNCLWTQGYHRAGWNGFRNAEPDTRSKPEGYLLKTRL
jgi:hypothetical protein